MSRVRSLSSTFFILAIAALLSGCGGASAPSGPAGARTASDDIAPSHGVVESLLGGYQPPASSLRSLDDDALSSGFDNIDSPALPSFDSSTKLDVSNLSLDSNPIDAAMLPFSSIDTGDLSGLEDPVMVDEPMMDDAPMMDPSLDTAAFDDTSLDY